MKASPDAYTLLMVSVANTVNATHYDKLDFNSGRINMASGGNGAPSHVVGELFKMMIGVNIVHVPYRGSAPTLTDLIGGKVPVMFDNMPSSIEHIRGQAAAIGGNHRDPLGSAAGGMARDRARGRGLALVN